MKQRRQIFFNFNVNKKGVAIKCCICTRVQINSGVHLENLTKDNSHFELSDAVTQCQGHVCQLGSMIRIRNRNS